jgi:hypothetical protein
MLIWGKRPWLIDHGASLYAHFSGPDFPERAQQPFPQIREHVMLPIASRIDEADREFSRLTAEMIREIVDLVPDDWLTDPDFPGGPDEQRTAYVRYLVDRLQGERAFVREAIDARAEIV